MDMDLKLFGSGMDVKPGTPPSARSTTPTSSPYRYQFDLKAKSNASKRHNKLLCLTCIYYHYFNVLPDLCLQGQLHLT